MGGLSTDRGTTVAPNAGVNTEQAADIARQGRVGNRRVSTLDGGNLDPIRGHVDEITVATPTSNRNVGILPLDDPAFGPISWFTDRLPVGTELGDKHQDHFQLFFGSKLLTDDMRNVVSFAQQIDQDILRASELLEKSERKPLNEKEQQEVNTLLRAGKYNLSQVQHWTSVARNELEGYPAEQEFITKLQERLADRHMALADLMCLYDIDQAPPEQSVSRADRIDHNLVAADAALKVVGGLTVLGLSGEAQQQLVAVLEDHRAGLGQAKDVAIGRGSGSDSVQVLSKAVWDTSFNLTKGKKAGDSIASLHKHWDAKIAGATGSWLPLAHPKLTQGQMLQEFVGYQLKQAGVAKKNMPDLKFQFKEATTRTMNERPWELIEKELHYSVAGVADTVHSKITPAKAMADRFAEDYPANGINCSDRMQYTHVPNLALTELTDEGGATLFSALRHGVLDAYDISASSLRKLPDHALIAMVKNLLVPRNTKNDGAPLLPPRFEDGVGRTAAGSGADATVQKTDNNPIAYSGKFQNTCPEECAVFVANHFNVDCKFETYKNTEQIDITIPLGKNAPETERDRSILFTDGKSAESCFNYLLELDKNSIYLMRTGRNDEAGHNQILYSKDNEWYAYDSATSQSQLTSSGALTVDGSGRLVKSHGDWGVGHGQSSITTVQITEQGVGDLIGFIKDCRNENEEAAIMNLYAEQPRSGADIDHDSQMQKIASESPYVDIEDLGGVRADSAGKLATDGGADASPTVLTYGDGDYATVLSRTERREQRVNQIVSEIRTNKTQATKYASEMRTVASGNMAKELAVAALVSNPEKLQAALDGEVVDLNLSSISLLTPDRLRSNPKSNERQMLRRQTEALQNLDSRFGGHTRLQVRDASGELRTVEVNCRVRTFNFGVNAGAVGRAKHIPSHLRGWDKLMGWGYAMERNDPQLRSLLGDPSSETLGGEVHEKINALEDKYKKQQHLLDIRTTMVSPKRGFEAEIGKLEKEIAAMTQNIFTLRESAVDTKKIWREGSYLKGGQNPYKMVSRLGMVINAMGETLTFNCKSGKDRTGQLDAELKYLTALSATGHLPAPDARVTPELRQMRSDFTLNSGNLEMQRMNTGLPGFKLDIKEVPGLANFIAGPEMESMYRGGSAYIKS